MISPPATLSAKKTIKTHTPRRLRNSRRARAALVRWVAVAVSRRAARSIGGPRLCRGARSVSGAPVGILGAPAAACSIGERPEPFQVVELSLLRREDVDDHVTEIDKDPRSVGIAFNA